MTNAKTSATPGPWRVGNEMVSVGPYFGNRIVRDGDGTAILYVLPDEPVYDEHSFTQSERGAAIQKRDDLAAQIVREHNAHAGLVAEVARLKVALERCANVLRAYVEHEEVEMCVFAEAEIEARAALGGGK